MCSHTWLCGWASFMPSPQRISLRPWGLRAMLSFVREEEAVHLVFSLPGWVLTGSSQQRPHLQHSQQGGWAQGWGSGDRSPGLRRTLFQESLEAATPAKS